MLCIRYVDGARQSPPPTELRASVAPQPFHFRLPCRRPPVGGQPRMLPKRWLSAHRHAHRVTVRLYPRSPWNPPP